MIETEHPIYVQFVKRHYGALIHMLWFVATETSDKGADIAARALALLAPLPNAVSVFNVSQHSLNFTRFQAFAFAFAMELALFAIIEVALLMWDGFLRNRKRYAIPLGLSIVASFGVLAIVVTVVYNLEVKTGGHWVLALLPFISLFAFAALGLKRWHERGDNESATQSRKPKAQRKNAEKAQPATQDNAMDEPIIALPSVVLEAWNMKQNGMKIPQIAGMQGCSERTVNSRLKQARAQLNGHSQQPTEAHT